jgi:hypothetical protein
MFELSKTCLHFGQRKVHRSPTTKQYFPQEWKTAKVVPVFKKGDPTLQNNYRPISLLCCISKLLEKIVESQVRSYMDRNGYFYTHQYGFRAGYQCAHAIIKFVSRVLGDRKEKASTAAIFLDIRKAFDCVSHYILYEKLEYYGIPSKFFRSYLGNRLHFTEIMGKSSTKARLSIGLPQGGVMSPLLFSIFVTDIYEASPMMKILYADDTVLLDSDYDVQNLERKCNLNLQKVAKWYDLNGLTLAADKTTFMLFNSRKTISLQLGGNKLECVDYTKYLGVLIDKRLNWKCHINSVASKIRQNLFLMAKVKYILPRELKLWLYNSLVKPYLDYACTVWGFGDISPLILCQKKALRHIDGNKNAICHTNPLFEKHQVMMVNDIITYSTACLMHSFVTMRIPFGISDLFNFHDPARETRLSKKCQLQIPTCHKEWQRKNIFYQGPKIWNELNESSKMIPLFKQFKDHLKEEITSKYKSLPKCTKKKCRSCK